MKTTIKEFIAPYVETITTPCLIGPITSIRVNYSIVHNIGLIETNEIEFDENGCVDFGYGRIISRLTETEACVWVYNEEDKVELTEQHSIYIEPMNSEEVIVLCLETMSVNKYKLQQ
jgi:hypothetical protein